MFFRPPLPFVGNKYKYRKELRDIFSKLPNATTIVDVFAGSGIISQFACDYSQEFNKDFQIICNDYYIDYKDSYRYRLEHIENTNKLLDEIREILASNNHSRDNNIIDKNKQILIKKCIQDKIHKNEFIDYKTLQANILFSGKQIYSPTDLIKQSLYNRVTKDKYHAANYLNSDLIIHTNLDFKECIKTYKNINNLLLILDPPYFNTDTKYYQNQFNLKDHLELILSCKNLKFIYFSSEKSEIHHVFDFLRYSYQKFDDDFNLNLANLSCINKNNSINTTSGYSRGFKDLMFINN